MNRHDSLRPITRRALRINYVSPGVCFLPGDAYSGGSSEDVSAVIDFVETTRLAGPVLTVSNYTDTQLRLAWTPVTDAHFYQVYRSTSPGGPFEFLFGPVSDLFYVDTPPSPGTYYYTVTAIEPNAGQTEHSNVGSGEILDPDPGLDTPPVSGYILWAAPESEVFSDVAGTVPSVDGDEVQFWQDLSGGGNHLKLDTGVGSVVQGAILKDGELNGLRALLFGETDVAVQIKTGLITDGTLPLTGGITVFCVGGFRTPPSFTEIGQTFVSYDGNEVLLRATPFAAGSLSAYHNSSATQIYELTDRGTADYLQTLRFDDAGNQFRLWLNGMQLATSADAGTVPAPGRVSTGFNPVDTLNSHFNGSISEIIVYPTALSDSERAAVEAYLMEKYAL